MKRLYKVGRDDHAEIKQLLEGIRARVRFFPSGRHTGSVRLVLKDMADLDEARQRLSLAGFCQLSGALDDRHFSGFACIHYRDTPALRSDADLLAALERIL